MTNSTPTLEIDSQGDRRWTLNGTPHRTDGPDIEYADGRKEWWVNGKRHRADGPAVEYYDGFTIWYFNDKVHRIGGPAIEYIDGAKEWWADGEHHRPDGPAIEYASGNMEWWVNGQEISPPCAHVLTVAFTRGLPIPEEAVLKIAHSMSKKQGIQIDILNRVLHEHWPTHVKKILVTLLSNPNPATKHMAFALLGREVQPASISSVTVL